MSEQTMLAWVVGDPGPIDKHPLQQVARPTPSPGPKQLRVEVRACGVCRTDLHLAEGDLRPRHRFVVPGHEIVGIVDQLGEASTRFAIGDRVGIPWLASTCGTCRFCATGRENLCVAPSFTGWDLDGGYAAFAVADEDYVYALPPGLSDVAAAPLLCAGIIGYRALLRAELPRGGRLGIYGFGASAHLTAQLAIAAGARVHVQTRSVAAQRLALDLGSTSAQGATEMPPEPLDAAILFAPVGSLVPGALAALDRGGTLAVAGVHLSDIPSLGYADHLFEERSLRSVTANTRVDGEELLELAGRIPLEVRTTAYAFEAANAALTDLAHGRFEGAAVLASEAATT